jgi:hypothetical protein
VFLQRGQHDITDELMFSNHKGYVFHDTRGFESGSTNELKIVQEFVRDRAGRKRLQDRLHAIWFVCSDHFITLSHLFSLEVLHPDGQPPPQLGHWTFPQHLS